MLRELKYKNSILLPTMDYGLWTIDYGLSTMDYRLRTIILIFLFLQFSNSLNAQDLHFSQYYAAPLYYNPANTGLFDADYRIGGNYKNQYPWARDGKPTNYRTFSAYADMALLQGKLFSKKDKIGVGIIAANDRAGDGNYTTTRIGASAAFHKVFGYEGRFGISFGINGIYTQKRVDYALLYFDNQWSDNFFDRDLPTAEGLTGVNNFGYFDLSAGASFSFMPNKRMSFNIGTGLFHINKPRESFYDLSNRLGIRPNIIGSGYIMLNEKWHLEPSVMFGYQKRANEFLAATIVGYAIVRNNNAPEHTILMGLSGRAVDAFIPVLGYQYKTLRVMLNYDINASSLTAASRTNGGVELSIVYMGRKPGSTRKMMIPCPRL
jgi:type IX secretion system PorP/SprF family membrane protein